jgi:hypothetical protein
MYRYMRLLQRTLPLILIGAMSLVQAQEKSTPAPGMDEMMKTMMALATPGKPHLVLAEMVGTWENVARMDMPGAPAGEPSKGKTVSKMILGGRFLQSEMETSMMGMPMHGVGLMGYDNYEKKYFLFWVDDMGTTYSFAEGVASRDGKTITLYGKMNEPTTGEIGKPVKYVYHFISKDSYTFEIHDLTLDGTKTRMMEVTYTRR